MEAAEAFVARNRRAFENDATRLEDGTDALRKAGLTNNRLRFIPIVLPSVQASDDNGVLGQIHHRAGTERGDRLAQANLVVRHF
jgi:hypothetical protein